MANNSRHLFALGAVCLVTACVLVKATTPTWRNEASFDENTSERYEHSAFDASGNTFQLSNRFDTTTQYHIGERLRMVSPDGNELWHTDIARDPEMAPNAYINSRIVANGAGVLQYNSRDISFYDIAGQLRWQKSVPGSRRTDVRVVGEDFVITSIFGEAGGPSGYRINRFNSEGEGIQFDFARVLGDSYAAPIMPIDESIYSLVEKTNNDTYRLKTVNVQGEILSSVDIGDRYSRVMLVDKERVVINESGRVLEVWNPQGQLLWSRELSAQVIRCSEATETGFVCASMQSPDLGIQLHHFSLDGEIYSVNTVSSKGDFLGLKAVGPEQVALLEEVKPAKGSGQFYSLIRTVNSQGNTTKSIITSPGAMNYLFLLELGCFCIPNVFENGDTATHIGRFDDQLLVSGFNGNRYTGRSFVNAYPFE